jgi:hypothetical protein
MKLARLAALVAVGALVAALAGVLQPSGAHGSAADTTPGSITVVGTGTATATPDRASFSFGTVSQAKTASAALATSSQSVAQVVAALKKAGVAAADLQTADVSLSPRFDDKGETILGYTASNTVTAVVRRLGQAGPIVDAAVAAGANQITGPSLVASDQAAAYRDALRAAVADARAKAQALAAASGLTTTGITSITEGTDTPVPLAAKQDAAGAAAPSIEPGTQEIDASVSVTFAVG